MIYKNYDKNENNENLKDYENKTKVDRTTILHLLKNLRLHYVIISKKFYQNRLINDCTRITFSYKGLI